MRWYAKIGIALIFIVVTSIPGLVSRLSRHTSLEKSKIPDKIYVLFRNDDISYYSDLKKERELLSIFNKYGASPICAIIPRLDNRFYFFENQLLVDSLVLWNNSGLIEPALHGFNHRFNKLGEFKRLSIGCQDSLLRAARTTYQSVFNNEIVFCPPWNQLDHNTILACLSNGISHISGFRGIPEHDSIATLNATFNLFKGDLPSLEEILDMNFSPVGNCILIVLYHSSYDFPTSKKISELEDIMEKLTTEYHCEFIGINQLTDRYSDYLQYINKVGIIYNNCIYQLNELRYFGFPTSGLQADCESYYNLIFSGRPTEASKELGYFQDKLAMILLIILSSSGLLLFGIINLIFTSVKRYRKVHGIFYVVIVILVIIGIIMQINLFAERPKWQVFMQFVIFVLGALGTVAVLHHKGHISTKREATE